jgi:hypothetical protein
MDYIDRNNIKNILYYYYTIIIHKVILSNGQTKHEP